METKMWKWKQNVYSATRKHLKLQLKVELMILLLIYWYGLLWLVGVSSLYTITISELFSYFQKVLVFVQVLIHVCYIFLTLHHAFDCFRFQSENKRILISVVKFPS